LTQVGEHEAAHFNGLTGGNHGGVEIPANLGFLRQPEQCQLQVAHDHPQLVVEMMGNGSRHAPQAFRGLGLLQLKPQSLFFPLSQPPFFKLNVQSSIGFLQAGGTLCHSPLQFLILFTDLFGQFFILPESPINGFKPGFPEGRHRLRAHCILLMASPHDEIDQQSGRNNELAVSDP